MTNSSSDASQNTVRFSWSTFMQRVLQASWRLLCFGAVGIVLFHLNGAVDPSVSPMAFLGGAIVLVALTLMGVPAVAAATAGVAIWLAIQNFL